MPSGSSHDSSRGEVFLDARGNGRAMRLSWHHEADLVVLSLWREGTCAGTFRLVKSDVGQFIDALVEGLRDVPGAHLPTAPPPVTGQLPVARRRPDPHVEAPTQPLSPVPEQPSFTDWAFGDMQSQQSNAC